MPYINRDENGKITGLFACQQYENQEYLPDDNHEVINFGKPSEQEIINQNARDFLNQTDWLVIRHRDQLALGIPTSLSLEEYIDLLNRRQKEREKVIED